MLQIHKPVLSKEVVEYLGVEPNKNFIDATVGEGGHAVSILGKNGPDGKVLGIDWDRSQIENSQKLLSGFNGRAVLAHGSYANLREIIEKEQFGPVHGILADVGYSSWHIEQSGRGFTFSKDEPLDMRYDFSGSLTAQIIVNEYPEQDIERIIKEYGEEKFSRRIAQEIIRARSVKRIGTTFELKEIINSAIPARFHRGPIDCATRTFQALRIAVNGELENIKSFLPQSVEVLESKGRLVVISFHSLEDRIVKQFFAKMQEEGVAEIITKKPVTAGAQEIAENHRSRSAKLRVLQKK